MKRVILTFSVLLLLIFSISPVLAQSNPLPGTENNSSQSGTVTLDNPLGENVTPEIFIGKIILAVLGVVGSLALVMFIYGGLTWMTASGNSEKVEKGKNIIIWAVIGLAVIFMSYAMVRFVFTSLGGAT